MQVEMKLVGMEELETALEELERKVSEVHQYVSEVGRKYVNVHLEVGQPTTEAVGCPEPITDQK